MNFRFFGFGVGAALFAAAPLASAQVAQSSTFNLSVFADADNANAGSTSDSWADSQGSTLQSFNHSLTVTDLNVAGGGPLTVFTGANASWVNAGKGSLSIFDTGWNFNTTVPATAEINTADSGFDVWTYTFQATADGTFDMNYNVIGAGDGMFGLWGAIIHWNGPGGDLNISDAFDPTANGAFSRNLVNGQTYTIGIGTYSNVSIGGGITESGVFTGQFDWQINSNPVPEPFSVAGLSIGVAALLRKRKKA